MVVISATRFPSASPATTWVVPWTPPALDGRGASPGACHGAAGTIGRGAIRSLEVDDLKVHRLTIDELLVSEDRREQT